MMEILFLKFTFLIRDNEVVKCNGKTVDLRKLKIGKRGTKGVKVRASKA